jgi:plastocyanin
MATYGRPPSTYTPPTATHVGGNAGTGATHTVIVAPTQGVLRFVPFALNASVGDTIKFMWGANNHTVTKSSVLLPCNATGVSPFASGRQDKGFIFNQVVTTTEPTFFHCAVATHCQKGMFGIINPPSALSSSTSIMNAMPGMAASNANVRAMVTYTNQKTAGNSFAANWGNSIDMGQLPEWSREVVAENTMYTRTFLAANPDITRGDDIDVSGPNPVMIPQDITAALTASNATTNASASATASGTTSPSASVVAAAAASSGAAKSGAAQLASPRVLLAAAAVLVTFLAL